MAGTRIFPCDEITHSLFPRRSRRLISIGAHSLTGDRSNVDDALSDPRSVFVLTDRELRESPSLLFDAWRMFLRVDSLAPGGATEAVTFDHHPEAGEHHVATRHLEDDGVEPVHEQDLIVRGLAVNVNLFPRLHRVEIRGQSAKRHRRLL